MSLHSFSFLFFMAVVAGIYYVFPRRYRYIWLCAASLFFYLSNDIRYFWGLLLCTAVTYTAGRMLGREGGHKKALLFICVGIHVLVLLWLRYPLTGSVLAPLGISFYALQAMGYVIDVYRGDMEPERNFVRYTVYVAFFPTVMSGPIQRAPKLLKQIREGREFDYNTVHSGLYLLLAGHLLKRMVANPLETMVNHAFSEYAQLPGAALLWATVLYAVQLYCDFAGYSALAIGAARVLGFDAGRNFAQPYFAVSVKDFWSRWHISLSSWLRDYIYIPLGGNRRGKCRKYVNLMITFLVSGLWHGAGLHYLVWGGIHGVYQILGDCVPKRKHRGGALYRIFAGVFTFVLVDFAWLFFRAQSLTQAFAILHRIVFDFGFREMTYYGSYLLGRSKWIVLLALAGIALVFFVDILHEKKISIEDFAARRLPLVVRWGAYIILTLGILTVAIHEYGRNAATFIYANF